MAPLRRYLRITKHSVLEVRIYLDRPSDAEAWLLKRDNPALPRIIKAVRPLVLPKLREESERAKGKSGSKARKKGVKDIVVEDDFEVSIFLTDLSSRHSVLTKQKVFKNKPRLQSNSGKLTGWLTTGSKEEPVLVAEEGSPDEVVLREEEDDEPINLDDIPEDDRDNDMVGNGSDFSRALQQELAQSRTAKTRAESSLDMDEETETLDEKKKLGLKTSYDGFSIYGRILCLVVKRKGPRGTTEGISSASSQQMMENWVSTQAAAEHVDDEDDNG